MSSHLQALGLRFLLDPLIYYNTKCNSSRVTSSHFLLHPSRSLDKRSKRPSLSDTSSIPSLSLAALEISLPSQYPCILVVALASLVVLRSYCFSDEILPIDEAEAEVGIADAAGPKGKKAIRSSVFSVALIIRPW